LATETIELTELENKVLTCFLNELKDYDFGFSDIICQNLVKPTQLKLSQIKGVIGSLTKKGLVFTDDMDTKHDLIFLAEKAYSLHSEWNEHATNHLQIKIIPTKTKTELPTVTDEPLATVTDEPNVTHGEPLATVTDEPNVTHGEPLATVTDEPLPIITDEPNVTPDKPLATVTDAPNVTPDKPLATVTDAPTTVTDEPLATTTPKGLIKYKSHEYQDGALLDYVHGIKAENGSFFTLCGIDADGGGSAFETEPLPNNAKIDCPFCKDEFEKSKIELMTQKKWFSQDEPKKTKEPKEKDDNMIKTALAETLKKVNTSNNDIMKLCHISKSELSEFKAEKRSTSLNRALEIVCNLNMTSQFLELLQILIKRKITAFTESKKVKKTGLHLKQLPLF
jgi:hypothetical protein